LVGRLASTKAAHLVDCLAPMSVDTMGERRVAWRVVTTAAQLDCLMAETKVAMMAHWMVVQMARTLEQRWAAQTAALWGTLTAQMLAAMRADLTAEHWAPRKVEPTDDLKAARWAPCLVGHWGDPRAEHWAPRKAEPTDDLKAVRWAPCLVGRWGDWWAELRAKLTDVKKALQKVAWTEWSWALLMDENSVAR